MRDEAKPGIRIPGLEIDFPQTWHGAVVGVALAACVAYITYLFLVEAEPETQQSILDIVQGNVADSAKQQVVIDQKNQSISELKNQLAEIERVIANPNRTNTDITEVQSTINETIASAERAQNTTAADVTPAQVMASIARQQPYIGIVEFFLSEKSFFGNYYWKSIRQIRKDTAKGPLSNYTPEDIQRAILELVELDVMSIQEEPSIIRYGLLPGPALEEFKQQADINID
jgi:type I restriction-modification system DNA methylase subunit